MTQDAATIVTITTIEARDGGKFAARVRVQSPYGDFHLEIPVEVGSDNTSPQKAFQAFERAKKELHTFIQQTLANAAADAEFKP